MDERPFDQTEPQKTTSIRRGFPILALVGTVAVLALGSLLGGLLFSQDPVAKLAGGDIVEIHLGADSVYVGKFVEYEQGYVRLGSPAVVVADLTAGEGDAQLLVQLLVVDPYDIEGDALIPREQITLIGRIRSGSGLEHAYRQATGEDSSNGQIPSPGS